MKYAGIGSRQTPEDVLALMWEYANVMRDEGYVLRSGHAAGADYAFELGAGGRAQIFLPWAGFNLPDLPLVVDCESPTVYYEPSPEAYTMAGLIHPAWYNVSPGAARLHARNCHQILGPDLDDPVDFVVCWTRNAAVVGGTATAIRLAHKHKIPVYNLGSKQQFGRVRNWLSAKI